MKYILIFVLFLLSSCTPFIFKIAEGGFSFDLDDQKVPVEEVVDYNTSIPHNQYIMPILILEC